MTGDEPTAQSAEPRAFLLAHDGSKGAKGTGNAGNATGPIPGLGKQSGPEVLLEMSGTPNRAPAPPGAPSTASAPAERREPAGLHDRAARPEQASMRYAPTPLPALAHAVAVLMLAALAVMVPLQTAPDLVVDVTQAAAFCVVFAGLWLLTHRMGLLSVGHGAFAGVGAYAALHAVSDFGLRPMLMPLAGFAAGCVAGALVGLPALRLPKVCLALLTLCAAVAFPLAAVHLDGPLPVSLDIRFAPPNWTAIESYDEYIWEYWIVVAWSALAFWLLRGTLAGRIGRALIAVRDEPKAAAAFGVPVNRLCLAGMSLSGGLAGLGGALLLVSSQMNDYSLYSTELSIKLFALTVVFASTAIGGSRLIMTVPAAAALVLVPVWLADQPWWVDQTGWTGMVRSELFAYAVLLIAAAYARSRRARALRAFQ